MSFTVTAQISARQFSYEHGSMLGALERSLALLTAGMTDVRITDGRGRHHTPAMLYQALFGAREAAPAAKAPTEVLLAA